MTWDRVTAFFCVIFIFSLSLFIGWVAEVTDNQVIRLLAILAFAVTWISAHKEQQAIMEMIADLQGQLDELENDEERDDQ